MTKNFTLLIICLLCGISVAIAQNINIKGEVKDNQGLPLPGVSVKVDGTSNGVMTNKDGIYTLSAPGNGTLTFSFIGYKTISQAINNRTNINTTLTDANQELNEVVVVGYGSQKKKDITSAISTISVKDVSARPIINTSEVLAGKAPGVQVFNASGAPGGGNFSVRIRGASSPNGSEPIYVVDGVVVRNTESIDPNNIESISVLKDASAAGIYGSLGATNGVVLITTKKGTSGQTKVEVNMYAGKQQIIKKLDMLNADQYKDLIADEYTNKGQNVPAFPANFTADNNWQDLTYRSANQSGINVGVSGGTDKGTFYLGLGRLQQDGIVYGTNFKRYSTNLSLEQKLKPWLSVGTNIAYNRTDGRTVNDNQSANRGGTILGALYAPPILPIFNASGKYQANTDNVSNPLDDIYSNENHYVKNNLLGNAHAEITLPFNIKYRSQFGISLNNYNNDTFTNPLTNQGASQVNGIGSNTANETFRYTWDNTLTYSTVINGKHNITAVVGTSAIEEKYTNSYLYGTGFPAGIKTLNAASANKQISTFKTDWTSNSYFGRINYGYNDKYLLTASLRADGSSRAGINNQWGYFPAVSGAWRISNEDFLKENTVIKDLKLRAGYGEVGNLPQTLYNSYSSLDPSAYLFGGNSASGYRPANPFGNPDLKWESTKGLNIGFDLSVLNDRIAFSADYYDKKTTNFIFPVTFPTAISGNANTGYYNLPGNISNKGIEFSITGRIIAKTDFSWTANLNASFNKNSVNGMPQILDSKGNNVDQTFPFGGIGFGGNGNNTNLSIVKNGLPLGAFYGYQYTGVDPANGNALYRKADGTITAKPEAADQTYLGSGLPKGVYGFTNSFNYKSLSLDILIDAVTGNKVYNATRVETESMSSTANASAAVLDRWRKPGDITDIPGAFFGGINAAGTTNTLPSSRFVENGSFVRLKSITLSYRIKNSLFDKQGIQLTVYATAQNLWTITKYKGYYPEVNTFSSSSQQDGKLGAPSSTAVGIDYGTYPQTKTYTAGLNLSF
ncbi:SusC/RagA family TonB-linked outer membrane protein [Pedobacter cryoconitis]|uniref:SusC/RagA family TonB-linked outer membrane protein n=1 Tax=Pedobacter cryoconitis TaxID=188932 RepID=UPI0016187ED6|nr:TonB-dependent receptor [Pedobacter cryoconitis]MBB5647902.1 TonB-linked SusC/RagA family outer membrane protein [Pedobacter cryoconitis]